MIRAAPKEVAPPEEPKPVRLRREVQPKTPKPPKAKAERKPRVVPVRKYVWVGNVKKS